MHEPFFNLFTHHFFNYINVSGVNPRFLASSPTDQILPHYCCHPLAFILTKQAIKKVKNIMHSPFYSLFTHHFFNYINVTDANPRFLASLTTDQVLPCRHCHPLAFIITEQQYKKRCESINFTVCSLTKFSIKFSFLLKPSHTLLFPQASMKPEKLSPNLLQPCIDKEAYRERDAG